MPQGLNRTTPFRIVVADDHPMCRAATRGAANVVGNVDIVEAATLQELLAIEGKIDLIVLDLGLPDSKGVISLLDVVRERPRVPILVVSGNEASDIEARVAALGAVGFVSKVAPLTDLVVAIRQVLDGGTYFSRSVASPKLDMVSERLRELTPAEARILRAMGGGELNKQIAHNLGIAEITVKQHISAILRKLKVDNRTQAILLRKAAEEA